MDIERIIKAWRSEEYRDSLSADERRLLPENPAGSIELDDKDLQEVAGASAAISVVTISLIVGCDTGADCFPATIV